MIGFQDFKGFNLALLSKQCWCIILSPSSLVAICLRTKYFPHGSFLDGSLGRRASYLRRTLLEGRYLLSLGLRHCIGNGLSTCISTNKWIPSLNGFDSLFLIISRGQERNVTGLIDFNQYCKREDIIRHLFLHYEAEATLQIPLNHAWLDYKFIQNFTTNEIYTVKSGYKISMDFVRQSTVWYELSQA